MWKDSNFSFAGDLCLEIEEIEKLIQDEEQMENMYTNTQKCNIFLTLKCC